MGFFGNRKEAEEHNDALAIKSASTSQLDSKSGIFEKNKNSINKDFNNPFLKSPSLEENSNNIVEDLSKGNKNVNKLDALSNSSNFEVTKNNISDNFDINNNNSYNSFDNITNKSSNNSMNTSVVSNEINKINDNNLSSQTPPVFNNPIEGDQNILNSFQNSVSTQLDDEKIQEMIDETVEKIIEEKWNKLLESVQNVVDWKDSQEEEIKNIKNSILEIKDNFDSLEKKIVSKISSYDSGLLDVSSEIKALEKVFQKITPTLINNVNNLEKIAISLKESTGVKVNLDSNEDV